MNLVDICPFVRFCSPIFFSSKRGSFTALDCRLFYVTEADGEMHINGVSYPMRKDTLFLMQPGAVYSFVCRNEAHMIAINFDYTTERSRRATYFDPVRMPSREQADALAAEHGVVFEDCPYLNRPVVLENAAFLDDLIQHLIHEYTTQPLFYQARVSSLLKDCIIRISRRLYVPAQDQEISQKIDNLVNYIHENFSGDLRNDTLAAVIGYHPYYLNRIFLQYKGVTLHRYVTTYRLIVSEQMLITTNDSVADIASSVGFSSIVTFTSSFKKKNQITPSEFRKKHRNYI